MPLHINYTIAVYALDIPVQFLSKRWNIRLVFSPQTLRILGRIEEPKINIVTRQSVKCRFVLAKYHGRTWTVTKEFGLNVIGLES